MNATTDGGDLVVRIATLRHALLSATHAEDGSFGRVQDLFMDLVEAPGFFEASRTVRLPQLEQIVAATVARFAKLRSAMLLILTRFGDTDFHHGSFRWGDCSGTVLWFEKDARGLLSVPLPDGQTASIRVGLRPTDGPMDGRTDGPTAPARRPEDLN